MEQELVSHFLTVEDISEVKCGRLDFVFLLSKNKTKQKKTNIELSKYFLPPPWSCVFEKNHTAGSDWKVEKAIVTLQ